MSCAFHGAGRVHVCCATAACKEGNDRTKREATTAGTYLARIECQPMAMKNTFESSQVSWQVPSARRLPIRARGAFVQFLQRFTGESEDRRPLRQHAGLNGTG